MKLSLLFILSFLVACTKMHDVETRNGIDYLGSVESEIASVKNIEWKVGKKKDKTVSRGIRVATSVPRISDNAKDKMYKKYGVDSWLFKFVKTTRNQKRTLGRIFYHFNNISRNTENFSLNIYYHSASVSRRFRNFRCPAFNHRLLINELSLKSNKIKAQDIYIREMEFEPGKIDRLSFSPHILSSGRSLIGNFHVMYALYNSKTKQVFSKWRTVKNSISVNNEKTVSLPSCIGVKEEIKPLQKNNSFNLRDLEIN